MPGGVNNYANAVTQTSYDYCTDLPSTSGAIVSGEFNSPLLQKVEQEGYLALIKPLEPAKLHALLSQWAGC
ncbi:Uncharacterised protein [Serratia ficaria]|nr:Uncharacterised protein [Serratia ficaria]